VERSSRRHSRAMLRAGSPPPVNSGVMPDAA
jgi:hypothetical protein